MIYILCVIHVAFWMEAGDEPFNSLILFEMPAIFFIAGAAQQLSNKKNTLWAMAGNRAKRVILPYYVYCVALALFIFGVWSFNSISGHSLLPDIYFELKRIIIPDNGLMNFPFNWHLWFIVPFLIISVSFPLQKILIEKIGKYKYLIFLSLAFYISYYLQSHFWQTIFGYNLFFIGGFLFYKKLSFTPILAFFVLSAICIAGMAFYGINPLPMQEHKIPPDIMFIIFGTGAIALFGLILSFVKIPSNRVLRRWNKQGYTIYIWQPIVFCLLDITLRFSPFGNLLTDIPGWIKFIVFGIFVFILSTMLSYIFVPMEKILIEYFNKGYNTLIKFCTLKLKT